MICRAGAVVVVVGGSAVAAAAMTMDDCCSEGRRWMDEGAAGGIKSLAAIVREVARDVAGPTKSMANGMQ